MAKLVRFLVAVVLADLCAGCMFEPQRAYGCNNVGIFGCKDKAQTPAAAGSALRRAEGVSAVSDDSKATSVSFGSFRLDLPTGWVHAIERAHSASDQGDLIVMRHPNGVGTLRIQSNVAPDVVGEQVLRNMTNVDSSVPLILRRWGEYAGYQYDYLERDSFFRQWWLANAKTLVFITYRCDGDQRDVETTAVNRLVNSLTVVAP